jgi:hypothetical protein
MLDVSFIWRSGSSVGIFNSCEGKVSTKACAKAKDREVGCRSLFYYSKIAFIHNGI